MSTANECADKKSVGVDKYWLPDVKVPVTFFLKTGRDTSFCILSSVLTINSSKLFTKVVSVLLV